jgi:hypothetical protein
MTHRWDLTRFRGYVASWSAVRAWRAQEGDEGLVRFFEALGDGWGGAQEAREVRWPVSVRAGRCV